MPRPIPRATSPLTFEPLSCIDEEVIWEEPESDDDGKSRHAKRRRIERLGESYLAGERLYILTAGLKGPFASGWHNPWKEKRTEVPNTVQRHVSTAVVNKGRSPSKPAVAVPLEENYNRPPAVCQSPVRRHPISSILPEPTKLPEARQMTTDGYIEWLKTDERYLGQANNNRTSSQRSPSPTPISRPSRPRGYLLPNSSNTLLQSTDIISENDERSPKTHFANLKILANVYPSVASNPDQTTQQKTPEYLFESAGKLNKRRHEPQDTIIRRVSKEDSLCSVSQNKASKTSWPGNQPNRALDNIQRQLSSSRASKRHVRRSLHTVPPSTTLPGFQYRPTVQKEKHDHELHEDDDPSKRPTFLVKSTTEQAKKKSRKVNFVSSLLAPSSPEAQTKLGPVEASNLTSVTNPQEPPFIMKCSESDLRENSEERRQGPQQGIFSTESTVEGNDDVGSLANIPSAQIPPKELVDPQIQTLSTGFIEADPIVPHNDTAADVREDSFLQLDTQAAVIRAMQSFQSDFITPAKPVISAHRKQNTKETPLHLPPAQARSASSAKPTALHPMSTQDMINSFTPFDFSTAKRTKFTSSGPSFSNKAVTIPNSTSEPYMSRRTPAIPFPRPPDPSDLSQETPSMPHPPLDMSTSPSTSPTPSPTRHETFQVPEKATPSQYESAWTSSILIRTSGTSSTPLPSHQPSHNPPLPTATATTVSSGPQQDGQQIHEEGFDLDATMDDIGSFLQSWDVERDLRDISSGSGATGFR